MPSSFRESMLRSLSSSRGNVLPRSLAANLIVLVLLLMCVFPFLCTSQAVSENDDNINNSDGTSMKRDLVIVICAPEEEGQMSVTLPPSFILQIDELATTYGLRIQVEEIFPMEKFSVPTERFLSIYNRIYAVEFYVALLVAVGNAAPMTRMIADILGLEAVALDYGLQHDYVTLEELYREKSTEENQHSDTSTEATASTVSQGGAIGSSHMRHLITMEPEHSFIKVGKIIGTAAGMYATNGSIAILGAYPLQRDRDLAYGIAQGVGYQCPLCPTIVSMHTVQNIRNATYLYNYFLKNGLNQSQFLFVAIEDKTVIEEFNSLIRKGSGVKKGVGSGTATNQTGVGDGSPSLVLYFGVKNQVLQFTLTMPTALKRIFAEVSGVPEGVKPTKELNSRVIALRVGDGIEITLNRTMMSTPAYQNLATLVSSLSAGDSLDFIMCQPPEEYWIPKPNSTQQSGTRLTFPFTAYDGGHMGFAELTATSNIAVSSNENTNLTMIVESIHRVLLLNVKLGLVFAPSSFRTQLSSESVKIFSKTFFPPFATIDKERFISFGTGRAKDGSAPVLSNNIYMIQMDKGCYLCVEPHLLEIDTPEKHPETQELNVRPPKRAEHSISLSMDASLLFVFGGLGEGNEVLSDLWAFNISSRCWKQLADSGMPRRLHGSIVTQNSALKEVMLVHGGWNLAPVTHVSYFYPGSNTWQHVEVVTRSPITGASPCFFLWRVGHFGTLDIDGVLWVYDPNERFWITTETHVSIRKNFSTASSFLCSSLSRPETRRNVLNFDRKSSLSELQEDVYVIPYPQVSLQYHMRLTEFFPECSVSKNEELSFKGTCTKCPEGRASIGHHCLACEDFPRQDDLPDSCIPSTSSAEQAVTAIFLTAFSFLAGLTFAVLIWHFCWGVRGGHQAMSCNPPTTGPVTMAYLAFVEKTPTWRRLHLDEIDQKIQELHALTRASAAKSSDSYHLVVAGNAYCISLATPEDALLFLHEITRRLHAKPLLREYFALRAGIHHGFPIIRKDPVHGYNYTGMEATIPVKISKEVEYDHFAITTNFISCMSNEGKLQSPSSPRAKRHSFSNIELLPVNPATREETLAIILRNLSITVHSSHVSVVIVEPPLLESSDWPGTQHGGSGEGGLVGDLGAGSERADMRSLSPGAKGSSRNPGEKLMSNAVFTYHDVHIEDIFPHFATTSSHSDVVQSRGRGDTRGRGQQHGGRRSRTRLEGTTPEEVGGPRSEEMRVLERNESPQLLPKDEEKLLRRAEINIISEDEEKNGDLKCFTNATISAGLSSPEELLLWKRSITEVVRATLQSLSVRDRQRVLRTLIRRLALVRIAESRRTRNRHPWSGTGEVGGGGGNVDDASDDESLARLMERDESLAESMNWALGERLLNIMGIEQLQQSSFVQSS